MTRSAPGFRRGPAHCPAKTGASCRAASIQPIGGPAQDIIQADLCRVVAAHDVHKIIRNEIAFSPREDDLALDVGDDLGLLVFLEVFVIVGDVNVNLFQLAQLLGA